MLHHRAQTSCATCRYVTGILTPTPPPTLPPCPTLSKSAKVELVTHRVRADSTTVSPPAANGTGAAHESGLKSRRGGTACPSHCAPLAATAGGVTSLGPGRLLNRHTVSSLQVAVRRAPRVMQASKRFGRRLAEPIMREAGFGTRGVSPRM